MEIMCDYFPTTDLKFYTNLGEEQIKNQNTIIDTIKGLLDAKNKVFVVVDNVHNENVSLIFNVINNLPSVYKNKDIIFLLAARQPEFDWVIEKNTFKNIEIVQKINYLFKDKFRYQINYFTLEEIKGFIEKYKDYLHISRKNKSINLNAKEIWMDSKGYPILVRFLSFQNGLLTVV